MAKYQTLKDEEIVRTSRSAVTESAAATFTEVSIDTQLSIERGVIWMVHKVEFHLSKAAVNVMMEVAQGSKEDVSLQLTRESKTAIVNPDNADLIAHMQFSLHQHATIGTEAGPLWIYTLFPVCYDFQPALPYASQSMFFGILGSDASAVQTGYVRVYYTIRSVSDKYFFRVAQALLG